MGLGPDARNWLLWHTGAGGVNRPPRQQLPKVTERCWMEACPTFALLFPDPCASAGYHLLFDGSCPTHFMFHGPFINLVLTFWNTTLRIWNSLTSNIKTINCSGIVIFPLITGPLPKSPQKVPAKTEVDGAQVRAARTIESAFFSCPRPEHFCISGKAPHLVAGLNIFSDSVRL